MSQTKRLYQIIATHMQAVTNCEKSTNNPWLNRYKDRLSAIETKILPSGGGIDSGTRFDWNIPVNKITNRIDKFVLTLGYHHMDDNGYYDGWTNHSITVKPSFDGITLSISGPNKRDIKDYLYEVYEYALMLEYVETATADSWGIYTADGSQGFGFVSL